MTDHPLCSIVPPYLLQALSASPDHHVGQAAETTLERQSTLRAEREAATATAPPSHPVGRDDGTKPNRAIFDAQGKTTLPGSPKRTEGAPSTGDTATNEAYDGLGLTWSLFHDVFSRDSLDNKGLGLVATVHYGKGYLNAFWNGTQMVFGDGDGVIFNRFTASVDVIGHELSHGFTQYTSGLDYSGQPGALNESVSDVFGSLVKQRALNQDASTADWLIGAGLLAPGIKGKGLRSMLHPGTAYDDPRLGTDPQPDRMSRFVETADDNGGVHINSGIPNRAFALVATTLGGKAWEAPGQIWYDVLTGDIKADCDFATFAKLTIDAAKTRYGNDSEEADAVARAWQAVEVTSASTTSGPRGRKRTPPKATHVNVRRSGGFAGLTTERTVDLAHLPSHDAQAWRQLLAGEELHAMADTTSNAPDSYCYGVSCGHPSIDVTIPEPALPEHIRELLDRTLDTDA